MENLLIIHGGGPTAVLNASLYGVLAYARNHPSCQVLAAKGGTGGLLQEAFIDLTDLSPARMELLLSTPGTAIGTSRDVLTQTDYEKIIQILKKHSIRFVLLNGGNGTMDTCGKLHALCKDEGICVMGIPKTMDNDIAVTDHSPGYGSAARFLAASVAAVCADVHSLPIHVVVVEALGRNAGWVTAAAALAADTGYAPDLIYLPERPFSEDAFLEDVAEKLKSKTGVVVVASEGLTDQSGKQIVKPVFQTGRATYFGDVGAHLAQLVIEKLGYKARSEKPGLLGRSNIAYQSSVDRREAVLAGEIACKAVLAGEQGKMVGFRRISTFPYKIEPVLIPLEEVMLHEKTIPSVYINPQGNGVTEAFCQWCRPLLGEQLPELLKL